MDHHMESDRRLFEENFDMPVSLAINRPPEAAAKLLFDGDADGAIPGGSRVVKCNQESQDSYPDGTGGIVISSLYIGDMHEATDFCYFVDFDPDPGIPVMILGHRIKRDE